MLPNSFNKAVRVWYFNEVKNIDAGINQSLPMEEKAKIAFDMRNNIRLKARDARGNKERRRDLAKKNPNPSFQQKMEEKMDKKHLTKEQAIEDIYVTAIKTNKSVDKELGIYDSI